MTTELQKLDEEIARIPTSKLTDADFDRRTALVTKRIELENAARAARDAAAGKQPPKGNIAVIVPEGMGISHFYGHNGRVACARVAEGGQIVLDLFVDEFRNLLVGGRGLDWQNANPEATALLGAVR